MTILIMVVCYPMKIDQIKPGELKLENMCAWENVRAQHSGDGLFGLESWKYKMCARKKTHVLVTLWMASLVWNLNSLIFLCKTLNSVMNIIEMRANTNIHIFQQNENLSKCFQKSLWQNFENKFIIWTFLGIFIALRCGDFLFYQSLLYIGAFWV